MSSRWVNFKPPNLPKIKATSNCKILTDYANELYREKKISKELYAEFINYIIPLCLEKMIEDKFNEIIPKWNTRFDNWLYLNMEEAT